MKSLSLGALGYGLGSGVRSAVVLGCAALLTGCKTLSPDGGMGPVAAIVGETLNKDVVAVRTQEDDMAVQRIVGGLLKKPLSADAAVQVALLNNRGR